MLAGLLALSLAACSGPERIALGGGGGGDDEAEPRGGIGGTGISPDASVGVIGTLTGFGSLKVNGLTLETDARAAASPVGVVELAAGHVLEAGAVRTSRGLEARGVQAVIALAGPVTLSPTQETLEIAGVEVRLETGAPLPPGGVRAGDRVAVSGLWRGDALVASRIDPLPEGAQDVVSGVVSGGPEGPRIGGMRLAGPAPDIGDYAVLTGRWTAEAGFAAESAQVGRPLFEARLRRLSVEGYLEDGAEGYALYGLGAELDPGARIDRMSAGRAVFIGRWDGLAGGRFVVEHGIPLPEGGAARAFALGRIGDGLSPSAGAVETR
ncbi:MAG: hypothetical protein AAGI51_00585 [Pseudomonadota bacterium]